MPPSDKAALVTALTVAPMSWHSPGCPAVILSRRPANAFYRLALITLGRDLASRAYPEINQLDRV